KANSSRPNQSPVLRFRTRFSCARESERRRWPAIHPGRRAIAWRSRVRFLAMISSRTLLQGGAQPPKRLGDVGARALFRAIEAQSDFRIVEVLKIAHGQTGFLFCGQLVDERAQLCA